MNNGRLCAFCGDAIISKGRSYCSLSCRKKASVKQRNSLGKTCPCCGKKINDDSNTCRACYGAQKHATRDPADYL